MKTNYMNRDQEIKHQKAISSRMQWLAIVTILTAIAIIDFALDLKDGLLTM